MDIYVWSVASSLRTLARAATIDDCAHSMCSINPLEDLNGSVLSETQLLV